LHPLPDEPDARLLERAKAGDDPAFADLYRRHHAAARSVAQRLCRSPQDAEDLVAQAFTAIFAALPRLDPERSFRAYLLACVCNGARDRNRRQRRVEVCTGVDADTLPTVGALSELRTPGCAATLMEEALRSLPSRWQQVLWLTAQRTSCKPDTVAALAHRARRGLRAAYLAAHRTDAGDDDCPACRAAAS
jgi:RNA polymerase sigma factor (sigma-70 family)